MKILIYLCHLLEIVAHGSNGCGLAAVNLALCHSSVLSFVHLRFQPRADQYLATEYPNVHVTFYSTGAVYYCSYPGLLTPAFVARNTSVGRS